MGDFLANLLTAIFGWLFRKKPNAEDAHAIKQTRDEAAEMAQPAKDWHSTVDDL